MSPVARHRLIDLSARIGCTPRALVLAAARMTVHVDPSPSEIVDALRRQPALSDPAEVAAVNLLLTPASSYAVGHVEDILASIWHGLDPRLR